MGGGEALTSGDPGGGPDPPRRSERRALRPRLRHCEAASPAGSDGEAAAATAPPGGEGVWGAPGYMGGVWGYMG